MNLVESAQRLFTQNLSPEVFLLKLADEIVQYHGETSNAHVRPPRPSPNPEKERGITTLYFDLVNFYSKWSIKPDDWRDLQPVFVELVRDYLASSEVDPRKLPNYEAATKCSGQRIHELALSGRYPADEVREQWFGGGD